MGSKDCKGRHHLNRCKAQKNRKDCKVRNGTRAWKVIKVVRVVRLLVRILHFVKFNKIKYLNIWILPNTSKLSEEIPSTELSSNIFYPFAIRLYFCKRWCNTPMSLKFIRLVILSSFLWPSIISICNYCPEAKNYTLWCSVIRVTIVRQV